MTQWLLPEQRTVRHPDSSHAAQGVPSAEEMEAASTPWYRDVVRDPGNYVGRHELSFSWLLRYEDGRSFRVNLGRPGEVDAP